MWQIEGLMKFCVHHQAGVKTRNGVQWVPARPIPPPLRDRLRDAWMVLRGKADAVCWEYEAAPKEFRPLGT